MGRRSLSIRLQRVGLGSSGSIRSCGTSCGRGGSGAQREWRFTYAVRTQTPARGHSSAPKPGLRPSLVVWLQVKLCEPSIPPSASMRRQLKRRAVRLRPISCRSSRCGQLWNIQHSHSIKQKRADACSLPGAIDERIKDIGRLERAAERRPRGEEHAAVPAALGEFARELDEILHARIACHHVRRGWPRPTLWRKSPVRLGTV